MEKSGKNAEGDSWWETWQEVLHQDEWRSDLMDFFFKHLVTVPLKVLSCKCGPHMNLPYQNVYDITM